MAEHILNLATDWRAVYCSLVTGQDSNWLFTLKWWLVEPSTQPKLAAKFEFGW